MRCSCEPPWLQEITRLIVAPEIAFTGDTTVDFITDPANEEVFRAKLLIMECTFLDDEMSPEDAKVSNTKYAYELHAAYSCFCLGMQMIEWENLEKAW